MGNALFVIADQNVTDKYYAVFVAYGSCGYCDTLTGIQDETELLFQDERDNSEKGSSRQQVKDYMTLALHIVQGLRVI